ncbi:Hypothetical predicted protein, partial [Pelobates cultripes]
LIGITSSWTLYICHNFILIPAARFSVLCPCGRSELAVRYIRGLIICAIAAKLVYAVENKSFIW